MARIIWLILPVETIGNLRSSRRGLSSALVAKEQNMKLSVRNVIRGKIVEVVKGQTTAHVRLDVNGTIITAAITNEAVDEHGLKKGMSAAAVVKASDVMIGVE
jgi:molybdopterin-binding protein